MHKLHRLTLSICWLFFSGLLMLGGMIYVGVNHEIMVNQDLQVLGSSFRVWAQEKITPDSSDSMVATGESVAETPIASDSATQTLTSVDARAQIVANFIERNDRSRTSPLQPYEEYGRLFVEVADEYGLDFRLLPAIARKESTFCKSNIARTYYNCFGYGVPASGITEAGKFSSYEEGFRTVAASLKRNYIDKGLTDPEAIMAKYCPPSAETGGMWAEHINQWMEEMRYDDKSAGQNSDTNADLTEFVE